MQDLSKRLGALDVDRTPELLKCLVQLLSDDAVFKSFDRVPPVKEVEIWLHREVEAGHRCHVSTHDNFDRYVKICHNWNDTGSPHPVVSARLRKLRGQGVHVQFKLHKEVFEERWYDSCGLVPASTHHTFVAALTRD